MRTLTYIITFCFIIYFKKSCPLGVCVSFYFLQTYVAYYLSYTTLQRRRRSDHIVCYLTIKYV